MNPTVQTAPPQTPGWVRVVGAFTLAVAIIWAIVGWMLFRHVGTMSFLNLTRLIQVPEVQQADQRPNSGQFSDGRPPARRVRGQRAPNPQPVNPLGILTFSTPLPPADANAPGAANAGAPGAADRVAGDRGADARGTDSRAGVARERSRRAAEDARSVLLAEPIRQGWALLTAILIGVIGAAGLGLSAAGSDSRWFWGLTRMGMKVVFAVSMFALGAIVARHLPATSHAPPPASAPSVLLSQRWAPLQTALTIGLVNLTQAPNHVLGGTFLLVALAVGAAAADASLRRTAAVRSWMIVVVVVAFLGTLSTLFGIALLIQLAKFPPLPPLTYAVVALSQSLIGWVMLWSLLYLPHPAAVRPTPSAPAVPATPVDPNMARVARRLGQ